MLQKFFNGLVFGAGFFVAVALLGWFLAYVLMVPPEGRTIYWGGAPVLGAPGGMQEARGKQTPLYDLPLEQQIERASAIIITRFEAAADGRRKAVVAEILKRDPGARLQYQVGDEYPSASYYPKEGEDRGDGAVVFFEGVSADARYSTTFRGDRVSGLGDIPLKLFREKCTQTGG
ncbi:MAG: hypothetical protein HYY98_13330 [Burkholderiales bacterium]|nr:hypothetical protein [Burkholderiales bacterium]